MQDARRTKEKTYPELPRNRRYRLVVLGLEVGGIGGATRHPALSTCLPKPEPDPPSLRAATASALVSGWSALLTHTTPSLFAASLLFEDLSTHNPDGYLPPLSQPLSTPTPAQLCRPVASQPGKGRSGLTPSLPKAKLETGQYKQSVPGSCPVTSPCARERSCG